jgi:hypothetical protein
LSIAIDELSSSAIKINAEDATADNNDETDQQ